MSLVKRENYQPTWSNLFNDFLNRDWFDWNNQNYSLTNTTIPAVNIKETVNEFEVDVAAPGMSKEDFKIELNNNVLTISSEKQTENETKEGKNVTRMEFSYQSFSRSFTLPAIVETERITAKYENGLLRVNIPKKEEAKPKPLKQIKVS
ncbi:MAG: Hsp20/alpha crystallin family protein [Lentimicrobiaceae bacterium]|jgi:HSP20 family protein